jgi:hypothetical protein
VNASPDPNELWGAPNEEDSPGKVNSNSN